MIVLQPTDTLYIHCDAEHAQPLPIWASWADEGPEPAVGRTSSQSDDAHSVVIVAAPLENFTRVIRNISIHNPNSHGVTVRVYVFDGTHERTLKRIEVDSSATLEYTGGNWSQVVEFGTMAGQNASDYTPTSGLAAVALSNDYDDLDNLPAIPDAQVNADWNATEGVAEILNKPTLGTAAAENVEAFATAAQGALADTALQPGDDVSELVNDADYQSGSQVASAIAALNLGTMAQEDAADYSKTIDSFDDLPISAATPCTVVEDAKFPFYCPTVEGNRVLEVSATIAELLNSVNGTDLRRSIPLEQHNFLVGGSDGKGTQFATGSKGRDLLALADDASLQSEILDRLVGSTLNVGTLQLGGTNILARANTWSAAQTFDRGVNGEMSISTPDSVIGIIGREGATANRGDIRFYDGRVAILTHNATTPPGGSSGINIYSTGLAIGATALSGSERLRIAGGSTPGTPAAGDVLVGDGVMRLGRYLAVQERAEYTTTGTTPNAPAAWVWRYNGPGSATINGFSGGQQGRTMHIYNNSSYDLILTHANSTEEQAARGLRCPGASDLTLKNSEGAYLVYDFGQWRVVGVSKS